MRLYYSAIDRGSAGARATGRGEGARYPDEALKIVMHDEDKEGRLAALSGECGVIKIAPEEESAMSDDQMKAELERLRKENEALKKGASEGIRMKVSEKGAVSIYGMGRFPVTLYKEQWLKLLNMSDQIRAFIKDNEARLKAKD